MEIVERRIICDCCGNEVKQIDGFRRSRLYMQANVYGGGSMGGDEDHREIYADLCKDCHYKVETELVSKFKLKLEKYKPYSHRIV